MAPSKTDTALNSIKLEINTPTDKFKALIEEFPCTVGRSSSCDLVIQDKSVSHRHAVFYADENGRITVRDLGSTNGIVVAGKKVDEAVLDVPSDLRIGDVHILIIRPNAGQSRTASGEGEVGAYYYRHGGREFGPYSAQDLRRCVERGDLHRTDLVWEDANENWVPAGDIPSLLPEDVSERPENVAPAAPLTEEAQREGKRGDVVCPHCWYRFDIEDFLYIARHHELTGDPVLGPEAQQRFLPSKFTPEGHAIDSAGLSCPDRACPRCHLRIPKVLGEMPPLFASIVGATGSGKSYFLTSMVWELRNILARKFAMAFTDTDAISNQIINDFEESLFLNADQDELVALQKTELHGELYNQVVVGGINTQLPKPFMFSITPAEHHPDYEEVREKISRTLVLYDNAGEHFEPGMDSVDNPTTQHVLYSDTVFFLFDPTKDVRFRARCTGSRDPQMDKTARVQRQEVLLTEMTNRIQKYTGGRSRNKSNRPLVIIIPKADIWLSELGYDIPQEPWSWDKDVGTSALDVDTIMSASYSVRALLEEVCPELVSTAESFSSDVLFVPNSALGTSPELDQNSGTLGIRPRNIKPFWITVPMLYHFYRYGLIPVLPRRKQTERDVVNVDIPGQSDIDV
ncbi:MAG: FHA domain-containing protein, partial [Lentisphaeria bacterium]